MTADARPLLVGLHDHGHRVPANEAADPAFDFEIAGVGRLVGGWNRIDVGCINRRGEPRAPVRQSITEPLEQIGRSVDAARLEHVLERIEPFASLLWIGVGLHMGRAVVGHAYLITDTARGRVRRLSVILIYREGH